MTSFCSGHLRRAGGPGFSIRVSAWNDPWVIDDAGSCEYTIGLGLHGIRGKNAPWAGIQAVAGPINITLIWVTSDEARRVLRSGGKVDNWP